MNLTLTPSGNPVFCARGYVCVCVCVFYKKPNFFSITEKHIHFESNNNLMIKEVAIALGPPSNLEVFLCQRLLTIDFCFIVFYFSFRCHSR